MKRITSVFLIIISIAALICSNAGRINSNGIQQKAYNDGYSQELVDAYKALCDYLEMSGIPAEISWETFVYEYEIGEYETIEEYLNSFIGVFSVPERTRGANKDWYYNVGLSPVREAQYDRYNLLSIVQPGDIIYESKGGFGITGHAAIVEGVFYDSVHANFYIRIIEAIGYISGSPGQADGVCRSVLDDDRYENKGVVILRVNSATSSQRQAAVDFCISQIGKDYKLDGHHDISATETSWYCSELVWAAYKNQGIDLEPSIGEPTISPRDLYNSTLTMSQSVISLGTPVVKNIAATSTTAVSITWNGISGANKYYVYRAASISGTYTLVKTTTATTISDSGLVSGRTYYYRIAASNGAMGNKSKPAGVKLSFSQPSLVNAYQESGTSVRIQWDSVYNATAYCVYRSTSQNGTYTKIATTAAAFYVNTGLTDGTTYYYKVTAKRGTQETAKSTSVSVKPTTAISPSIYFGKSNAAGSATIKWTHISEATQYYVYRSTSMTGTYTKIATVTKTYYIDEEVNSGRTYYYKVASYNSSTGKTSAQSAVTAIRIN